MLFRIVVAGSLTSTCLVSVAKASNLPGAIGNTVISAENYLDTDHPGLFEDKKYDIAGNHVDSYAGGVSIVEALPAAQYVRARAFGASGVGVVANSEIDYAVTFLGSAGTTISPLVIGNEGSVGTGPYYDTFEAISITSDAGVTNYYAGEHTGDPNVPTHVHFADVFTFTANVTYDLSISAGAYAGGGETSSAYADPYFLLTPQQASQFQMVFSPGIGNVPSVPLPGSASLFGTALFALGAFGCGVKLKKAAAA